MKISVNNRDKNSFVFQSSFFSFFFILFSICLIGLLLVSKYPKESELIFEKCTFIKYEYKRDISTRHASKRYYIYVEEYDRPLEIDNIVFNKVNEDDLKKLSEDDSILVSTREFKGNFDLYSMSADDIEILTYNDYLSSHNRNTKIGLIVLPILMAISGGMLIWGIFHYKRTGECLPI